MSFFWLPSRTKHNSTHDVVEETAPTAASLPKTPESQSMREPEDTAHDRALRELGITTEPPTSTAPGSERHVDNSDKEEPGSTNQEKNKQRRATELTSAAFPPGPEEVYDPATGSLAGFIRQSGNGTEGASALRSPPTNGDAVQSPRSTSGTTRVSRPVIGAHGSTTTIQGVHEVLASEAQQQQQQRNGSASLSEDMWNQLSKIRVLQSEIARMHLALDKPGIIEGVKSRRGTGAVRGDTNDALGMSMSLDGTGVGVGLDNTTDAAGKSDQTTTPEDEFAKRKGSIGAIMAKLDALSVAVTEFHTLPTPPLDFPSPSSTTSSRVNSLQPQSGLDRDNNARREFSEPSLMSNISNMTPTTTRPPGVDAKDYFKPVSSSALTPATPNPINYASTSRFDSVGSGVETTTTLPLPPTLVSTPAVPRRLPSPLSISTAAPYSLIANVEPSQPSQSSSRSTPSSAQSQSQNHAHAHGRGQGQRLETLYEPQGEPPGSSEVPPTPVVPVERVVDGVPTGNFRVTSQYDSPLGTPSSLLRRAVSLPEEGPATPVTATAGGRNVGPGGEQKKINTPAL